MVHNLGSVLVELERLHIGQAYGVEVYMYMCMPGALRYVSLLFPKSTLLLGGPIGGSC